MSRRSLSHAERAFLTFALLAPLCGCPPAEPPASDCRAYGNAPVLHIVDRIGDPTSTYDNTNVESGAAYAGLPSCLGFDGLGPGAVVPLELHERVWGTEGCFQYHGSATTLLGTVFGAISWNDQLDLENDALLFDDVTYGETLYLRPAILLGGGDGVTPACRGDWVGMISEPFPTEHLVPRDARNGRVFGAGEPGGPAPVYVVRAFRTVYADRCPGLANASPDGIYACADLYAGYLTRE